LQDPSIQKVLRLIAEGKEVNLKDPSQKKEESVKSMKTLLGKKSQPEEVDLNSLSNDQLVDVISGVVEDYVASQRKDAASLLNKDVKALETKLVNTQNTILQLMAQRQVTDAQEKFPDFETHKQAIGEVIKRNPTMTIEDAYYRVLGEKLVKLPSKSETESEKPESSVTFPEWKPVQQRTADGDKKQSAGPSTTPLRLSGGRGFRSLVEQAAIRLDKS
jgi:hypothetical protein